MAHDRQAVQAYLDDLLRPPTTEVAQEFACAQVEPDTRAAATTETAVTPTVENVSGKFPVSKTLPATEAVPAPAVIDVAMATAPADDSTALEALKRQQLQALLDRAVQHQSHPQAATEVTTSSASEMVYLGEASVPSVDVASASQTTDGTFAAPAQTSTSEQASSPEVDVQSLLAMQWCENGRPEWAQQSFDVLLLRVAGLTLAVPLVTLGHIHPLTDGLTPIIGQADWFMGLQPTPAGQIRVINTAQFVMPERYDPSLLAGTRYVVTINGLDWGLAVDEVQQPIRLDPDAVTWRTSRTKRPWLAGTVKSAMCALLDIPTMGILFQAQDRNRTKRSNVF